MTMTAYTTSSTVDRQGPSTLADVVDVILDKGMVVDTVARVSLVGVEILFIDARFVIASIDTYVRFAHMVERLAPGEPAASGLID
jgi:hypothetical protein